MRIWEHRARMPKIMIVDDDVVSVIELEEALSALSAYNDWTLAKG